MPLLVLSLILFILFFILSVFILLKSSISGNKFFINCKKLLLCPSKAKPAFNSNF